MNNQTSQDAIALVENFMRTVPTATASAEFLNRLRGELNAWSIAIAREEALKIKAERGTKILAAKYTPGMIAALETLLRVGYLHSGKPTTYSPDAVPGAVISALRDRDLVYVNRTWRGTRQTARIHRGDEDLVRQVIENAKSKAPAKTKARRADDKE